MKKLVYIIVLWMLTASGLLAQTTLKDRMTRLENVFGTSFVYSSDIDVSAPYNGPETVFATLEANLDALVKDTGLEYSISGSYVSLKRARATRFTLRGHVTDASSSETLIAAGILVRPASGGRTSSSELQPASTGTVSNEFGFYSITLPQGDYDITYTYIGYGPRTVRVSLDRDLVKNAALRPALELSAATITARSESGIFATRAGAIELPKNIIDNTPVLLGEADVLKTLQMLPGVQGGLDGFSGIFVRGGADDENLLLLDGVPLYNASHMLGIFSVFTPEAVKKVTLYKGDFPARYGGRISSVVDVRTNDGDMHSSHGTVSVGLLSDKLHLEGPLKEGMTSYSVSARVLHTFLFTPALKAFKVPVNYYFYDFNAKVNHRFSDRDRIYAAVYHGRDYFQYDDVEKWDTHPSDHDFKMDNYSRIRWGNTLGTMRWNHVYGPGLFSNATLFVNSYRAVQHNTEEDSQRYSDGLISTERYESVFRTGMKDYGAKMDFDWNPSPEHAVRFGGAAMLHTYHPSTNSINIRIADESRPQRDTSSTTSNSSRTHGGEFSLYAEDDFVLSSRFRVNAGLHLALFTTQGKVYFSPQPRLSARYELTPDVALKAGYSRMAQYIHRLASGAVGLPTDHWVPITRNIRPVTSNQVNAGAVWSGVPQWEFSADAYWKEADAVLEYRDAAFASAGSADWDRSVAMGHGRSYGVELLARKTEGKTTGWLAYTLGKTDRIFRDGSVNGGRWFPYRYDRRHVLVLCANHRFNDRIDLSAVWNYASGASMTVPTRMLVTMGYDGDYYYTQYVPSKGNYRLPPSHRLDVSANFRKQKKHGERTWNVGVYNVYAQRNPTFVEYDMAGSYWRDGPGRSEPREGEPYSRVKLKKMAALLCIPSVSYTYRF